MASVESASGGGGGGSKRIPLRGRRKLEFKRFLGKTMFLDLPGYRHAHLLEEELTTRGATVETQFHSGVRYLVTLTRNQDGKTMSPSTPSPNTPGTAKSSLSQLMSPVIECSPTDPKPRPNPAYYTRAQQMLRMSQTRGGGRKADLLSQAKQWGCKVVTLDELLAELKRLKPLPPPDHTPRHTSADDTQDNMRELREPFLKVEDLSGCYRPLVLEMEVWPAINYDSPFWASPFDPLPAGGKQCHDANTAAKQGGGGGGGGGGRERGRERDMEKERERRKRPGYCECCRIRFEDLTLHLSGPRHQEYASNDDNFVAIDRLMVKSFEQFISEVTGKDSQSPPLPSTPITHTPPPSSHHQDSVSLITIPTSPARSLRSPWKRSPRRCLHRASLSPMRKRIRSSSFSPFLSPSPSKQAGCVGEGVRRSPRLLGKQQIPTR